MVSDKVLKYYDEAHFDYQFIWGLDRHLSMHYGYYDDDNNTTHTAASQNMNKVLAETAGIKKSDIVLDAGCGVGGSSIWIARNIGAKVVGLNIHDRQLKIAESMSKKYEVEHLVKFIKGDYLSVNYPDSSFDVVWALESICHSEHKGKFFAEAARLLKKGGRIIIADGFTAREDLPPSGKKLMEKISEGWAVPYFATPTQYEKFLQEAGFHNILYKDIVKNIMPNAEKLNKIIKRVRPFIKILELLRIRTKVQAGNMRAARLCYKGLKNRTCCYGIFYAEKAS